MPIIVTGMDLSIDIINEVTSAEVAKHKRFALVTRIGAFDDRNRQRAYILSYMPPHVSQSDSGRILIDRAWNYCRGRYVPLLPI